MRRSEISPVRGSMRVRIRKSGERQLYRLRGTGRNPKVVPGRRKFYSSLKPFEGKEEAVDRQNLLFSQKVPTLSPIVQTQTPSLFEQQRESFERFWRIKSAFDFSNLERGIVKQSTFSGETLELPRHLAPYNPFISPGDNHLTSAHMSPTMALSPAFEEVENPARVSLESGLKFQTPQTLRFEFKSFDSEFGVGKQSSARLSRASRKPKIEDLPKLEFPGETKVSIQQL